MSQKADPDPGPVQKKAIPNPGSDKHQKEEKPATEKLNVIALISGGKDSLYSLLHCLANGHTIVALANLHPPSPGHNGTDNAQGGEGDTEEGEEDMNSYMYQTIGHRVIPLYEEALGIPLYRAPITGSAVDTRRIYHHPGTDTGTGPDTGTGEKTETETEKDETEALVPLLRHIQKNHPEANALSTGAILSTYQRTRVESVASRLGLISLSWLWMYPYLPSPSFPSALSSTGTDRETGLLDDMATCTCETRIIKVASGGLEDADLWTNITSSDPGSRKRILRRMRRFASDGDARAAVLGEGGEYESLALDGPGFLWKRRIQIDDWERGIGAGEGSSVCFGGIGGRCVDKIPRREEDGGEVGVQDVPRPGLFDQGFLRLLDEVQEEQEEGEQGQAKLKPGPDQREAVTHQMLDVKNAVEHPERIVFATVLLRSMDDFAPMNNIYTSLFPNPNPPARVTIACDLPPGVNVQVSFEYDHRHRPDRQGLHVQSRSYWAPANIGPYSQSISIPLGESGTLVYVAGQIPLDPASMDIVTGNYATRAVLALQHLWRIGAAMQVNWWVCAVAYVTASGSETAGSKAQLAWKLWKRMHVKPEEEEDEDVDIWDIKNGQAYTSDHVYSLPDFSLSDTTPPFLAVQVADLPRNTDIEWQGLGCQCTDVHVEDAASTTATTTTSIQDYTAGVIEIGMEHAGNLQEYVQNILEKYSSHRLVVYTAQTLSCDALVIPCRGVWGRQGRRLIAGIRFSQS